MQSQSLQYFLEQVKSLNRRYDKINQLSGENFNVFRILKLQASEVRLHSTFLAELLNPKGSHGQKDTFLKLFIELFQFKNNNFDSINGYTEVEKHTGLINENKTEGGRIDIFIADKNRNHIIIENKIYAPNQEKQLVRYRYHYPNADLFYLTLEGRHCEEAAKDGLLVDKDYKCLSYKNDITKWLELCRKEVAINPTIRETITQYLHLIKYLNNQTINYAMTEELSNLINSNLEAAFTIANNIDEATDRLIEKLTEEVSEIAQEVKSLGFIFECTVNLHERDTGFLFYKEDWEYASILFQFQEYGKSFVYGVATDNDMRTHPLPTELKNKLTKLGGSVHKTNWWPIFSKFEDPFDKDWTTAFEPWVGLLNGDLKRSIRTKLIEMIDLIGELKL